MQVITFKAKPKTVLGIVLALAGAVVILMTFLSNHSGLAAKTASATPIQCATDEERAEYLKSLGWQFSDVETKDITVPAVFNQVYENYNAVQKRQGFDLEQYKGKQATVYTYHITNYKDNENVIANLIVSDGKLIAADLCDPSAKDGFLTELKSNENTTT